MSEKKILNLTLNKQWFDLILLGQKKQEYREYKKHWCSRLLDKDGNLKSFDEVHFTNGYGSTKPFVSVEFKSIAIVNGMHHEPKNDEPLNSLSRYFVIHLGKVLRCKNIKIHS